MKKIIIFMIIAEMVFMAISDIYAGEKRNDDKFTTFINVLNKAVKAGDRQTILYLILEKFQWARDKEMV